MAFTGDDLSKTLIYNIENDVTSQIVSFDSVTDREGRSVCANKNIGFMFRDNTYSSYGPVLQEDYVLIKTDEIEVSTSKLTIKKMVRGTPDSTYTIDLALYDNISDIPAQNVPLPEISTYNKPNIYIPIT